jgi:uracil phosphoribosyltransferase
MLHTVFDESQIRQDHIYISRTTDTNEQVTGSSIASSKIGGDVDNAVIFIPDPMGATGSSISNVISGYKNDIEGKIKKIICIHLIITPEYIEKLTKDHPDAHVYALRLDDGLDDKQYIMPGAGGIGELLNNSFV